MKNLIYLLLALTVVGCTYEGKTTLRDYIEDPRMLIKDPHFTDYKDKRDALEKQYLAEEITYADYVEGMDALDAQYNKEVAERNAKVTHE